MINKETITSILKGCIETLENRQTKQVVDYTSIVTKKQNSASSYDYAITTNPGDQKKYLLTVTPNGGKNALITLDWWYSINNTNVVGNPVIFPGNRPSVMVSFIELPMLNTQFRYSFSLDHNSNDTSQLTSYFKFVFTGTDDITWTMTQM